MGNRCTWRIRSLKGAEDSEGFRQYTYCALFCAEIQRLRAGGEAPDIIGKDVVTILVRSDGHLRHTEERKLFPAR